MVNTLRNGEIAIMNWIDIDKPTEGYHFKDLTQSESGTKFKNIVKESNDTPTFEYVQGANTKDNLKSQILATTLYDAVMKYRSNLVKEKTSPDITDHDFFSTSSWEDFKKHGRMIAQFMGADDEKINETLNKMENMFAELGGDGGVQLGFEKITNIEKILSDSGIAKNGDSNGVIPEIKIRHFLDLLSDDFYSIGRGKGKKDITQTYDTRLFIDMVLERNARHFAKIIDNPNTTIKSALDDTFRKKFGERTEEAWRLFRKIVRAGNYKKNGAEVGKSEIALALFFGDCQLPRKKGDILLTVNNVGKAIEMKGTNAVITNRTILYKDLKGMSYADIASAKFSGELSDATIWKTLELDKIDVTSGSIGQELDGVLRKLDKIAPKGVDVRPIKFKVLFGALLRSYFTGRTSKTGNTSGGFDMMLIMDTNDEVKNDSSESPILNKPLIKVEMNKSNTNWYREGARILKDLKGQGINVTFLDAHAEGGFKAI